MESDQTKAMTEEEFMALRTATNERMQRLVADDLGNTINRAKGNIGPQLLELRIKSEQMSIDINTLVNALIATGVIEKEKFLVTALQLMQERIKQLEVSQSKIILATARAKPN